MFHDERPARVSWTIWVAAPDTARLICARCNSEVFRRDVAFLTRTAPGRPFDPWCHECAQQLSRWALAGIDYDLADQRAADVIVIVGEDFDGSK